MRLINAEWRGFASYADVATVSFNTGLTGIIGSYTDDKRKSMGAGKSTIVMTLLYALFNKGSFKTVSEVINDTYGDKDHMYVKYTFIKNSNTYTVERGILNGSAYLDLYENGQPLGDNKIESRNKQILEIVGWDYDMFTASIFFEQDKLSKLVDADGAKRREYIEKILNTRDWTLLQDLPKKRISKINDEISLQNNTFSTLQSNIKSAEEALIQYLDIDNNIEIKEKEKVSLAEELSKLKNDTQKEKESIIVFLHKRDTYKSHIQILTSIEKNIEQLNSTLTEITKVIAANDKILTDNTQVLSKNKKESTKLKFSIEKLELEINELKQEKTSIERKIYDNNTEIKYLESFKNNFKDSTCDKCGQHIAEDYALKQIEECTNKIKEHLVNIEELKKQEILYTDNIKEKQDLCSEQKEQLADYNLNITKLETENNLVLKNIDLKIKEKDTQESQLRQYSSKLKEQQTLKKEFDEELVKLNIHISNLEEFNSFIEEKQQSLNIDSYEKIIEAKGEQLQDIQNILNNLFINKGIKTQAENNIIEYKAKLDVIEANIASSKQDIEIENYVLKGFKEIPSNLFARNIDKLQNYANEYIKKFIPHMEVCVKEDTEKSSRPIEISYKFREKERSYRMLSGGQKTIANLGLRLAFSKIITEKTNSVSEFIILDEPFGYLDEYSRDLVKNVLSDLQKYYKQIIIISHVDNVTDFPNIIHVRMENNKSYIL